MWLLKLLPLRLLKPLPLLWPLKLLALLLLPLELLLLLLRAKALPPTWPPASQQCFRDGLYQ
jgi:hypothetical protein